MGEHPIAHERAGLCELMHEVGPDAPTWCGDWTTFDLAAHLWARERRPDTGPGLIMGGAPARHTERVRLRAKEKGYATLIDALADGPPLLGFSRWLPDLDVHEWFVHHEDVRRPNGREPRGDLGALEPAVWKALGRFTKLGLRSLDMGIRLRTTDGREQVAKTGSPVLTLTAPPGELLLRVFGRPVEVDMEGDPATIDEFCSTDLGV